MNKEELWEALSTTPEYTCGTCLIRSKVKSKKLSARNPNCIKCKEGDMSVFAKDGWVKIDG